MRAQGRQQLIGFLARAADADPTGNLALDQDRRPRPLRYSGRDSISSLLDRRRVDEILPGRRLRASQRQALSSAICRRIGSVRSCASKPTSCPV